MTTVTVPRADVTNDEVSEALRKGLGPRYHVLPGMKSSPGFGAPTPDEPNTILVGTGSDRLMRAQVRIDRTGSQTRIRVLPSGLFWVWIANNYGIARKVTRVLQEAPSLGSVAKKTA